jgi:hypothetical protein
MNALACLPRLVVKACACLMLLGVWLPLWGRAARADTNGLPLRQSVGTDNKSSVSTSAAVISQNRCSTATTYHHAGQPDAPITLRTNSSGPQWREQDALTLDNRNIILKSMLAPEQLTGSSYSETLLRLSLSLFQQIALSSQWYLTSGGGFEACARQTAGLHALAARLTQPDHRVRTARRTSSAGERRALERK